MCTGNVFCEEISTNAVFAIANYLNITPQLVDAAAHIFKPETDWGHLVAEQNLNPQNPQTAYRELRQQNVIWIYGGHACIEAERD